MDKILTCAYTAAYSESMSNISSRLDEAMETARPRMRTQSDLAFKAGVSQPTVNRILKGAGKHMPGRATIKKLADACGVNVEWLEDGSGPKLKNHQDTNNDKRGLRDEEILEIMDATIRANDAERNAILASVRAVVRMRQLSRYESRGHE